MTVLVDVRTAEEYESGYAEGALHVSLEDIYRGELGPLASMQKDTPIVLYCQSGGRAEMAKQILLSNGFSSVTNAGSLRDVQA